MSSRNEEYFLAWNNHGKNFSLAFGDLLQGDELVDVKLVAEGHLISAHRLVLSAMSPYFRKMFTQMPANQQAFVFLKDISKQTVADLITFIYCGEVNVKQEHLEEFMNAAIALNIKGLADGSYSHSLDSRPVNPTPAKATSNGSAYQTPDNNDFFGSAGVQYQSIQRSAQSTQYQQPINVYQKQDCFVLNGQNQIYADFDYDSNYDQNYEDENNIDSMYDYKGTSFDQWNGESGSNANESKTMATAPKRFKTNKDPSEYDIEADIRVNSNRVENLFYSNYKYNKNGKPNAYGAQRWKCTKEKSQKCRAAASTMNVNGVTMMKVIMAEHNHAEF